jgi:hypothetical protein
MSIGYRYLKFSNWPFRALITLMRLGHTRYGSGKPGASMTKKSLQSLTMAVVVQKNEKFLREAADRIRLRISRTAKDIIDIGRDLIAVKESLGHGNFLAWIDREFGMNAKSAERFISVAQQFGDKFDSVSNLSLTVLYELAAPSTPEEVKTKVTERLAAGDSVTGADVKALKNEIKERDDKLKALQTQKATTETDNRLLTQELKTRETRLRELTQQLDSLRDELRGTREQSDGPNQEPMKAALLALWDAAPEEVRAWFLEAAVKGSDAFGSGGASCPS